MRRLRKWFGRTWDRLVVREGHRRIGPVTMYSFDCAMHGGWNIETPRWGRLCIAIPWLGGYETWRWYLYLSPNCTPWASTLLWGRDFSPDERRMARVRHALWGHGYDCERLDPQILDRSVAVVEYRDRAYVEALGRMVEHRAAWIA